MCFVWLVVWLVGWLHSDQQWRASSELRIEPNESEHSSEMAANDSCCLMQSGCSDIWLVSRVDVPASLGCKIFWQCLDHAVVALRDQRGDAHGYICVCFTKI